MENGIPAVLAVGWSNFYNCACRCELERTEDRVVIQYGFKVEVYEIDEDGLEVFAGYL